MERLAGESHGRVVAVHYDQHFGAGRGGDYSLLADEPDVRAKIAEQVERLGARGVEVTLVVREGRTGSAAAVIAEIARQEGADVIVAGTRGHGALGGALLGSVTQGLLREAPCPVLVIPPVVAAHEREQAARYSRRL